MALPLDFLDLEKAPASDIKTKGWPGLMRKVRANGAIVVTNHHHPEAVVVDAEQYRRLVAEASAASTAIARTQSLKALQAKFDAHLASLKDASSLAQALSRPARRGKKIALGKSL
ncbi:type II toxin-antitoxin system prevent-host-death family antitoxin [Xanthomonas hyacinthi]|uniref:Antitoxin n=1 Tax=Xanthomonas hyacinthi TaxID=56455 RepID=A0A2S7ETQ6_9XANT|nr:type II toxin-antitoxin system prevent-host-death family antitoxin [Xanthomonas hyacinthi]KLD74844.1 prevent-host-death protein [Xanthomonas hyacinthi DSM 19077]PPU96501.1 type II toxin-antitoxin system prevent-host-death family antitoxin [Xanthomonas hyacinthi]QGY78501.1 type II toxin-antitoxin system prevent-host-death family antitoxin [Xanthomonas hyacinthi]